MKATETLTAEQEAEKLRHENKALRAEVNARLKEQDAAEAEALTTNIQIRGLGNLPPDVREIVKEKMEAGLDFHQALSSYVQQRRHDAYLQAQASAQACRSATRAAARVGKECGNFFEPEITEAMKASIESQVEDIMQGLGALKEGEQRRGLLKSKVDRLKGRLDGYANGESRIDMLAPDAEKRLVSKMQVEEAFRLTAQQLQEAHDAYGSVRREMATRLRRFGHTIISPIATQVFEHLLENAPRVLAPFYLDPFTARNIIGQSDAARFILGLRDSSPWGRSGEASIDEVNEVLRLAEQLKAGKIPFNFDCTKQFEAKCAAEVAGGLVVNGQLIPLEGGMPKRHADVSPSESNMDVIAHSLPEPSE